MYIYTHLNNQKVQSLPKRMIYIRNAKVLFFMCFLQNKSIIYLTEQRTWLEVISLLNYSEKRNKSSASNLSQQLMNNFSGKKFI